MTAALVAAALLAGPAWSQDGEKSDEPAKPAKASKSAGAPAAPARGGGMMMALGGRDDPNYSKEVNERLKALRGAFRKEDFAEKRRQMEESKKAQAAGGRMASISMNPSPAIAAAHLPHFQKAAADFAGTDGAIPFLNWIITSGRYADDRGAVDAAATTLLDAHVESPRIVDSLMAIRRGADLFGEEGTEQMLRTIEAKNPSPVVKGQAVLARVEQDLRTAETSSEAYASAKGEALAAAKVAGDDALTARVDGLIAGRESIVVGNVAPDIVGTDLDGVDFKLSDYKGKVILLDFWGDW